ncbi:hypothetical protein KAW96_03150 [candidate division WOR-3 bacterium]|nr:hypothetical protein [candidate division WOR-3 bacterium]
MKRFILVCLIILFSVTTIFAASKGATMGAQMGVGVVGGAAGFMIGTANACCLSCVSSIGSPSLKDFSFLSGTMTTGGLVGTVLGGTAGVYLMGNLMLEDGKKIENPWETFFATMAGGFASCACGYVLDFTMHKVRGEGSIRPGSFYLVGLMLSPIAETFVYHQFAKEKDTNSINVQFTFSF